MHIDDVLLTGTEEESHRGAFGIDYVGVLAVPWRFLYVLQVPQVT